MGIREGLIMSDLKHKALPELLAMRKYTRSRVVHYGSKKAGAVERLKWINKYIIDLEDKETRRMRVYEKEKLVVSWDAEDRSFSIYYCGEFLGMLWYDSSSSASFRWNIYGPRVICGRFRTKDDAVTYIGTILKAAFEWYPTMGPEGIKLLPWFTSTQLVEIRKRLPPDMNLGGLQF